MNSLMDDREDDMRLPGRGAERRTVRDEAPSYDEQASDREFTLSTGTVLGMFFALALICAVFFGFGYTMGRKSGAATAETAAAAAPSADTAAEVAASKPSPGSPAIQAIPGYMSQSEADAANRNPGTQTYKPVTSAAATPMTVIVPTTVAAAPKPVRPAVVAPDGADVPPAATTPTLTKKAEIKAVAATLPPPAAVAVGTPVNYVQIAAVSHQEDADVLLSALKRRGYTVFARPGDSDKLIHVQVGPFATKKDADAMKQRLMGDGYNAIVK